MNTNVNPLSRSLLGAKRTWVGALHMSAFDPRRTFHSCQFFCFSSVTVTGWYFVCLRLLLELNDSALASPE
jgi:hypothetical protein